jgi:hypothetical protein
VSSTRCSPWWTRATKGGEARAAAVGVACDADIRGRADLSGAAAQPGSRATTKSGEARAAAGPRLFFSHWEILARCRFPLSPRRAADVAYFSDNHGARRAQVISLERGIKPAAASRRPPGPGCAPWKGEGRAICWEKLLLRRAGPDRHLRRLGGPVPNVGDVDLVAGLLGSDRGSQVFRARDRFPAEGRDHVAGLEPGLIGG